MANNVIKRTWNQNKMVCIEDLSGMAFQSESGGHTFEISGTNDSGTAVSLSGTVEARFLRFLYRTSDYDKSAVLA